eukprot:4217819-Prymnesium_polylepis.1
MLFAREDPRTNEKRCQQEKPTDEYNQDKPGISFEFRPPGVFDDLATTVVVAARAAAVHIVDLKHVPRCCINWPFVIIVLSCNGSKKSRVCKLGCVVWATPWALVRSAIQSQPGEPQHRWSPGRAIWPENQH